MFKGKRSFVKEMKLIQSLKVFLFVASRLKMHEMWPVRSVIVKYRNQSKMIRWTDTFQHGVSDSDFRAGLITPRKLHCSCFTRTCQKCSHETNTLPVFFLSIFIYERERKLSLSCAEKSLKTMKQTRVFLPWPDSSL